MFLLFLVFGILGVLALVFISILPEINVYVGHVWMYLNCAYAYTCYFQSNNNLFDKRCHLIINLIGPTRKKNMEVYRFLTSYC